MLHESPLRLQHESFAHRNRESMAAGRAALDRPGAAVGHKLTHEVEYIPYGVADERGGPTCEVVATFGEVEAEYAAIRRGAGLFDSPHRGTLLVTGSPKDRREFLNRMLTQELKDLAPGVAREGFWLNRKGRIDADLFVFELGDRLLIDLDIHQAAPTVKTLSEFLFSEDVSIVDASSDFHHIALHGRAAPEALARACGLDTFNLESGHAVSATIAAVPVVIARRDQTAEPGFELIMPYDGASAVWTAVLQANESGDQAVRTRPIGWYAFNIARIEAGTPVYNIDFGPTSLPHESGILERRVSFTKGCYLGQEIVARMENLGRPKQTLVGLRVQADALPVAGGQVFAMQDDGSMGQEIGVVTSSTLSPMLGAVPIAFATVKTSSASHGSTVIVNAEGQQVRAVVGPLHFWPAAEAHHDGAST